MRFSKGKSAEYSLPNMPVRPVSASRVLPQAASRSLVGPESGTHQTVSPPVRIAHVVFSEGLADAKCASLYSSRSAQPLRAYPLASQQQCIARLKGLGLIGSRRKKRWFQTRLGILPFRRPISERGVQRKPPRPVRTDWKQPCTLWQTLSFYRRKLSMNQSKSKSLTLNREFVLVCSFFRA